METFTHQFKVRDKEFTVDFSINPELATGNPVFVDTKTGFTSDIVNNICIHLIKLFENNNPEHFTYETPEPYWFFHDVCHTLYTPHLLFPKVLTIPRDVEQEMVRKGLELARECKLPEEYITRIPAVQKYL